MKYVRNSVTDSYTKLSGLVRSIQWHVKTLIVEHRVTLMLSIVQYTTLQFQLLCARNCDDW